jgi:uncharacterized protein (TIGR03437 family)
LGPHIRRFGVAAFIIAAVATSAFAQVTLVANPSSLTFNVAGGTPPTQDVEITSSSGAPVLIAITSTSPGISHTIVSAPNGQGFTPETIRVSVNPSLIGAGTITSLNVTTNNPGISGITIPINITGGAGTTFGVNPTFFNFSQTGATPPPAQATFVLSNTGVTPSYIPTLTYLSGGTNWLSVSPALGQVSTSATVTVTPTSAQLGTGVYQATLTLTPQNIAASPVQIPITLSVNQSGATQLTASPASLVFTFPSGTATAQTLPLFVSSASTSVAFTPTLSSNLIGIVNVTGSTTTPTQLNVTVPFPQFVPAGTTGTLTLTPTTGSGFGITTVPIQINSSGFPGFGSLSVNPATLTFTAPVGLSATVPAQNLTVTSFDGSSQFIQISATSTNNFLFVTSNSSVTPATLSVGVNMAAITQPGTYIGTITLTPLTGTGSGIPTTVQVTLNATSAITVTPTPSSVSLSAGAGTAAVQQNVVLSTTTSNVPFTAAATTTSGGSWLSVSTSDTLLPGTIRISANPASLTPGSYSGSVTVTAQGATVATIPVTFTVTAAATLQITPTSLTFNHQTTSTSQPASQPIQVNSSTAGITWNATAVSTGGWLDVSPRTGTTPGTVNVSVNAVGLSPGTYTGTVSVTSPSASNSPQNVNVTLNVSTPVIPQVRSIVNAASLAPSVAVPGLIATIFGADLGPATPVSAQVTPQGFIDTTLGGVRVLFDGIPAPILYASATQVNVVVPYEIAGRFSTRMRVEARNQNSPDVELRVADTAPGVFTTSGSGSGQGAVLNQNGTVNGAGNPEQRGNVIVIYATGHGQTTPQGTTGRVMPSNDLRRVVAPVVVRIGGREAEVFYAGSAPGLVSGALQINARIPADAATGSNVPVEVQIGNAVSQTGVTVAIQ